MTGSAPFPPPAPRYLFAATSGAALEGVGQPSGSTTGSLCFEHLGGTCAPGGDVVFEVLKRVVPCLGFKAALSRRTSTGQT